MQVKVSDEILRIENLVKHFPITRGILFSKAIAAVRAVDGIGFSIKKSETLGLVGESGCGKSTTGRLILRLIEATSGKIWFEGRDIVHLPDTEMRLLRRHMQIIFQDPYGSLNPRMTIQDIIGEPLQINGVARRGAASPERSARFRANRPIAAVVRPLE